jgi:hypothetical protein
MSIISKRTPIINDVNAATLVTIYYSVQLLITTHKAHK